MTYLLKTHTNPETSWNAAEARFDYHFATPITINLRRVAWATPGLAGGSIVSTGGPPFNIELSYVELEELLTNVI